MLNDHPPVAKHFIDVVSLKVFTRYYCFYFALMVFLRPKCQRLVKIYNEISFFPESFFQQID